MVEKSYKEKLKFRKRLLEENKNNEYFLQTNDSKLLISVPHAVSQLRLGKYKVAEIGTLAFGYILSEQLKSNLIIKTKNNNDDANFDEVSAYRDKIKYLISAIGVKYIIDIHGMKKSRECDVNLGINLGNNIKIDTKLYDKLQNELRNAGFSVQVDQPFKASSRTISGYFANNFNVWTIQIEINCGITNDRVNNDRANLLLEILAKVFKAVK